MSLSLIAISIIYIIAQLFIVWFMAIKTHQPSVIDVAWASGLMVIGVSALFFSDYLWPNILLSVIVAIWGLRLAGFLWWTRIRQAKPDSRYQALTEQWKNRKQLKLLINYSIQSLLLLIIATPFYFFPAITANTTLFLGGVGLSLLGITFEHVADRQLYHFKNKQPGHVCNVGLWQYSRHPNYFFEWLVWVGFSLCASQAPYGYLAFISPLLLLLIMTRITGPLTETCSIKSRGDAYRQYQQRVSMFFPWLPRK